MNCGSFKISFVDGYNYFTKLDQLLKLCNMEWDL